MRDLMSAKRLETETTARGRTQRRAMSNVARRSSGIGVPLEHTQQRDCVYLDYNATTPVYPEVGRTCLLTPVH